ncbi:MAG: DNA repair protein RadA, partial [Bacteroidales bacterium]|nr:DNA repair protein RadA [Bacteroidales bacterium]
MAKPKTYYFCSSCGYQSSSWLGKCPECGKWNTFSEEVVAPATSDRPRPLGQQTSKPKLIQDVTTSETKRIPTRCGEFDRVLGGGIVPGSLLLLGGEPGIGKSTLLLQTALSIPDRRILYVSGEESEQQIKMRADRLMDGTQASSPAKTIDCYVVSETVTQRIMEHVEQIKPDLLIVDSIQTISTETIDSSAGSISQIRECTAEFQRFAKENGVPVLLVGHITKDGTLAGPKVMEHIVDCVLQFEGDRNYGYRLLRSLKNRFGSTAEIGIFEMNGDGLREVANPSEFLLSQRDETLSGCAVAATLEG